MKTTIIQFAPVLGDIDANIMKTDKLFKKAGATDLFVLPELASTGYKFKNRKEAVSLSESKENSRYLEFLSHTASKRNCFIVSGFNERDGDKIFNSSVLTGPKGIIGIYRKLHLFWDEKKIFDPGDLGLPVFDTEIGKLGIQICFDWMFPESWRVLALKGAAVIAHPTNLVLPYCQSVIPSYSLVNRIFIITANRTGTEDDLTFTGNSIISDPKGKIVAYGQVDSEETITADIDLSLSENKMITPENDAFKDRRTDVYGNLGIENPNG